MKAGKPSVTARFVARTRATLDRPEVSTGDAPAEHRLYESLGRTPLGRGSSRWRERMARRTAFFDRVTLAALDRGVCQIVIVGAGYDGRPLRFATPGVTWFEVDHPATQSDKRVRLAAACASTDDIVFVPIDLTTGNLVRSLVRPDRGVAVPRRGSARVPDAQHDRTHPVRLARARHAREPPRRGVPDRVARR